MSRRSRLAACALVLTCFAIGILFWTSRRPLRRPAEGSAPGPTVRLDTSPSVSAAGSSSPDRATSDESDPPTSRSERRVPIRDALIEGWVSDQGGGAVEGARITLTALRASDRQWEAHWRDGEWGPTDSPTRTTTTDAAGRFAFHEWIGDGEEGRFVLEATADGFARTTESYFYPVPTETTIRLRLTPAPPVLVTVLGSDGQPIEGALVEQHGLAPSAVGRGASLEETEENARFPWGRYVHDRGFTDALGEARFPRIHGEQVFIASLAGEVSLPWRGEPGEHVLLRLRDSFELSGTIELPDWSDLGYEGERRLRITLLRGSMERSLAVLRHVEEGSFGPLLLPRVADSQYWVHLEGSPIVPVRESFLTPSPGEMVHLDLKADRGRSLWIAAVNEQDEILLRSKATLSWWEEGVEHHVSRGAGPDGYIDLWSFPQDIAQDVDVRIEAPGYVTRTFLDQDVSYAPDEMFLKLKLERAGTLRGHVTFRGEPAHEFSVLAMSEHNASTQEQQDYWGRADGSFELQGVSPGTVLVLASSELSPPGDPIAVTVRPGEVTTVDLVLAEGAERKGVVVNGLDGTPIPGARVRQLSTSRTKRPRWWGTPVFTNDLGEFTIPGLKRGTSILAVDAEGFSNEVLRASDSVRKDAPALHVELFPLQSLDVTLVGWPGGDYSGFYAESTERLLPLPRASFSKDGHVHYDSVGPGRHEISIRGPLGPPEYEIIQVLFTTSPRRSEHLTIRVGSGKTLQVRGHFPTDSQPPPGSGIWISYRTKEGLEAYRWGAWDTDTGYSADCFEGSGVWVSLIAEDGRELASGGGAFHDGALTLDLDASSDLFRLRVVDAQDQPVTGVEVRIHDDSSGIPGPRAVTDARGVAEIRGLPKRTLRADLFHESKGLLVGALVDASKEEGELTLSNAGRIRLAVASPSAPLPGAEAALLDAGREAFRTRRHADSSGGLEWTDLTPGPYRVRVRAPDHWTVELEVDAGRDPTPIPVVLRRLGSLTLRVVSVEGEAVAGAPLELTDVTTGSLVRDWVRAGRIQSSGPRTDPSGTLHYEGLPEGTYRVRITGAGDVELGTVEVVGGVERVVELP